MLSAIIMIAVVVACESSNISRIIGGEDTTITEHPWQAFMEGYGSFRCGAVIIDSKWVATAAHCVAGISPRAIKIYVGSSSRIEGASRKKVRGYVIHPAYNSGSGFSPNDVALIRLRGKLDFNSNVQKISLGSSSDDFEAATSCYITGWGRTEVNSNIALPNILQEAEVSVNNADCSVAWGANFNPNVHLCVVDSANEAGSCNGDSGGPLVCDGILAGLTSWGVVGCSPELPSVYARISTYSDWINSYIGK